MSMVAERAQAAQGLAGQDPPDRWWQRIVLLEDENAALRERERHLERERQQLRERIERLEAERERLAAEGERLQEVNACLRGEVEALRRAAKRQAAPFSRDDPSLTPSGPARPAHLPGAHPGVRASPVVAPDETGWRVGGRRAWLWAFVGKQVTVYRIAHGHGYHEPARCSARAMRGCWNATAGRRPQVHRCDPPELPGAPAPALPRAGGRRRPRPGPHPHAVRRILLGALELRDAHQAGTTDQATQAMLLAEADRLAAQLDKLVAGRTATRPTGGCWATSPSNGVHLFTFLRLPGVQATNWRAEQAIRPAVVTCKSWGGNRTWAGADTWQVLASVLRTATQQARDPVELLVGLLQAPPPTVANLAIPGR